MGLLAARISELVKRISYQVYEKDQIFNLAMLALLSEESIFLLGKPGIAKSLVSRRMKYAIRGGRNFEYLMSKFSTPEEIYGPIDLRMLKEGKYVRNTTGYLPDAHIGFLDEIWKAGPSIQNTLLTIINEKIYRNGGQDSFVPLKLLISASNELPAEGEGLEALFDRFIIRYIGTGLKDRENFEQLLSGESSLDVEVDEDLQISIEELAMWRKKIKDITISKEVFDFIQYFRQKLERETNGEAYISDRRWKKIAGLMKTSAFFNDREKVELPDMFVIPFCIWDNEEQESQYFKYFKDAFLDQIGIEYRHQKVNLLNELDVVQQDISQIEAKYLRYVAYENPLRLKEDVGTCYRIMIKKPDGSPSFCFIRASDWSRVLSLSKDENESFDIELLIGESMNKFQGTNVTKVRAYGADRILFLETKKHYTIENENPEEYNSNMSGLIERVNEIQKEIEKVTKTMYDAYSQYKNQTCIFFPELYDECMKEALEADEDDDTSEYEQEEE